jgi:hypothetical protein
VTKQFQQSEKVDDMQQSIRKMIRVRKEDSAYVYCILESYEGATCYSTLNHQVGDRHRDLELRYTKDFENEVSMILKQLGELVYETPA